MDSLGEGKATALQNRQQGVATPRQAGPRQTRELISRKDEKRQRQPVILFNGTVLDRMHNTALKMSSSAAPVQ